MLKTTGLLSVGCAGDVSTVVVKSAFSATGFPDPRFKIHPLLIAPESSGLLSMINNDHGPLVGTPANTLRFVGYGRNGAATGLLLANGNCGVKPSTVGKYVPETI